MLATRKTAATPFVLIRLAGAKYLTRACGCEALREAVSPVL